MNKREFTLKHVFENVGELEEYFELDSPEEGHFGVKWKINIQRLPEVQQIPEDQQFPEYQRIPERLGIMLYANMKKNQEIYADLTMKIFSKNKEKSHSKSQSNVFGNRCRICCDWDKFIEWKTLENEYLDDGKLEVEVHVKINVVIGFPKKGSRCFGKDKEQFSDVILKVEDRKFYVSKLFLATHSPYFVTLFLGKFQESEKSEVVLKDVDAQDFEYYLEVLYGYNGIADETVQGILSVADMFDTPLIVEKCEEFLVKESKLGLKKKLELAGNYRLEGLKTMCLNQIKSKADIRSIAPDDPRELGIEIFAELFKKALDYN